MIEGETFRDCHTNILKGYYNPMNYDIYSVNVTMATTGTSSK